MCCYHHACNVRYDNPYTKEPWTTHAGHDELSALRLRVAELEEKLDIAEFEAERFKEHLQTLYE